MNLKKWWSVILMGGLILALSAASALAWTHRPSAGHNANYRGGAPTVALTAGMGSVRPGTTATPTDSSTTTG